MGKLRDRCRKLKLLKQKRARLNRRIRQLERKLAGQRVAVIDPNSQLRIAI